MGLAVSDPMGIIAKPLKILDRKITPDYIHIILDIAKEKDVHAIVVGLPLTLKGKYSTQTKVVQDFIDQLPLSHL